jgi:hypothetical protein
MVTKSKKRKSKGTKKRVWYDTERRPGINKSLETNKQGIRTDKPNWDKGTPCPNHRVLISDVIGTSKVQGNVRHAAARRIGGGRTLSAAGPGADRRYHRPEVAQDRGR